MKHYSKLAALGAALVLTSAYGLADTFPEAITSNSGGTFYMGYSSTFSGAPSLAATPNNLDKDGLVGTQVQVISPGPFGTRWKCGPPRWNNCCLGLDIL